MATYGLEVASLVMSYNMRGGPELLSWVRGRLIMAHTPPNAFDRLWHALVIAIFENLGAADAAQEAAESALKQFPGHSRFVLALGWAEEQRLYNDLTAGRALPNNKLQPVLSRLTEAMAFPDVRGEALLRFGRVELATRRYDAALRHLDEAEPLLTEPGLRYLRELFRGRALASLGRASDGEAAYDAALGVVPGAQSATMAKSELLFLLGDRGRAESAVDDLLRREPAVDPWWVYPRGDARFAPTLIASLRGELK
jgi:tetratricopeptide (TPR) repeat protein